MPAMPQMVELAPILTSVQCGKAHLGDGSWMCIFVFQTPLGTQTYWLTPSNVESVFMALAEIRGGIIPASPDQIRDLGSDK